MTHFSSDDSENICFSYYNPNAILYMHNKPLLRLFPCHIHDDVITCMEALSALQAFCGIPLTNASNADLWYFLWCQNKLLENSLVVSDLRHKHGHVTSLLCIGVSMQPSQNIHVVFPYHELMIRALVQDAASRYQWIWNAVEWSGGTTATDNHIPISLTNTNVRVYSAAAETTSSPSYEGT